MATMDVSDADRVSTALDNITVTSDRLAVPRLRVRAEYTEYDVAAYGYGRTADGARADLAETLAFNLTHNGSLV